MMDDVDLHVVGDFNLRHFSSDRNKLGSNLQEIFGFNKAISILRLVEIPLKGI
jgi:hypothetical protein